MTCERTRTVIGLIVLLLAALVLSGVQHAIADGNDIAIEMISLQVEGQQVDTDGDGRLETFSANYTVYADGTAVGFYMLDEETRVEVESGRLTINENNEVEVEVQGDVLTHEVGHWLRFQVDYADILASGGSSSKGPRGILVDFSGWTSAQGLPATTFSAEANLSVR